MGIALTGPIAQRREGFFVEKEREKRFGRATVWPSSDKQCMGCSTSGAKALLLRRTPKQWHASVFLNKKFFTALPIVALADLLECSLKFGALPIFAVIK